MGAREAKELYIPPSQSMSVPSTSKEQALKWVRGVEEGTCVMMAEIWSSISIYRFWNCCAIELMSLKVTVVFDV